jgi:ParB family chromosome partitioning protein
MAEEGRRLGRGLAALLGDVDEEAPAPARAKTASPAAAPAAPAPPQAQTPRKVPIEFLIPNPRNPRRQFSEADLEELASSVRERGIIQPVVVRAAAGDRYEIIAGERRWRAAQRAGLHEVPIVLVEATDRQALEMAIVENVQRSDLNPLEEAQGYNALAEFGHDQEAIARIVGKSRSHVANMVRLLKLSDPVKAYILSGKLSAGHARMLVGQPNAVELAEEIVDRGLNVRQVEAMARKSGKDQVNALKPPRRAAIGKDADTVALEKRVSDALGLQVSVDHREGGWGILQIHYRNLEQLEDVLRKLEAG